MGRGRHLPLPAALGYLGAELGAHTHDRLASAAAAGPDEVVRAGPAFAAEQAAHAFVLHGILEAGGYRMPLPGEQVRASGVPLVPKEVPAAAPKAVPEAAAPTPVELLAAETDRAVAHLRADPMNILARLGGRERGQFWAVMRGESQTGPMLIGKAVEREPAARVAADPGGLGAMFEWTKNKTPGPDFIGIGPAKGTVIDITTAPGESTKYVDGVPTYGQGMSVITHTFLRARGRDDGDVVRGPVV